MNFIIRNIAADAHGEFTAPSFSQPLRSKRKWPIRYRSVESFATCGDVAIILIASVVSTLLYRLYADWTTVDVGKAVGSAIVVAALCVSLLKLRGMYRPAELLALRRQVQAVCLCWAFVFLLLSGAVGALNLSAELSRGAGAAFAVVGLVMLIGYRVIMRALLLKGLDERKFSGGNVVLITDQAQLRDTGLAQALTAVGFRLAGHFSLPRPGASSSHRKRLSALVVQHARGSDIEEIIVEADPNRWSELREFVAELRVLPFPVVFVPIGAASEMFAQPTRDLGSAIGVEVQRRPLTPLECAAKRCIDLIGAGICLIMLAPLLGVVAIIIKLDSAGPVLFRQQRCGFNGRSFSIYKFRTMLVLEDGPSVVQAKAVDSRVTWIGKWLRRTSIDELPQLLNVLDGSMSLVGPRPHAMAHDSQFDEAVQHYAFRRRVKPGLTGWAQIHGCRGPTPTRALIEQRVEYDLWYIDNWSLRLDLAILLRTPVEVLRARNAF
ncbi:undecaprenyl-phosphate glucose phosphotransferase [Bradyrhizobium sp. BRP22]|uniref:undecaprenyl-phosphate glucose phosphotransferase n=1 Tax=Bradyrhizobium sp. BRP22 TaxID=2793821 RepID=UPI001CD7DB5B|nr:undecaprenyl-phosphate glucose phosphotransferase [Bradyrhizobium sp. BRP22]MCA1453713.1 undecaprenyl-phosphate glucose phosphotransferase [Bradyrhizobium sp. BRP22]